MSAISARNDQTIFRDASLVTGPADRRHPEHRRKKQGKEQ
jgi:hypothetical protein